MSNSSRRDAPEVVKFGKVGNIDLAQVPLLEDCNIGMQTVVEYNVLIAPAVMPEKIGSIIISDQTKESFDMAMQMGLIVQASPLAFNYDKYPDGTSPKRGDIVWFARYGGGEVEGMDGRTYRIIKDKDVMAVVRTREQMAAKAAQAAQVIPPRNLAKGE